MVPAMVVLREHRDARSVDVGSRLRELREHRGDSLRALALRAGLTASFISTILGTKLPGYGCIYLSQTLRFKAPVKIGDTVRALARISSLDRDKRRAGLDCMVSVGDKVVLEGEALVLVPSRS